MDKEYRNLLRHAETENDFIRVERIQVRKGLRTPITLINNYKREHEGTVIETESRTGSRTETRICDMGRTRTMIRTMTRTKNRTMTITGNRTWIRTETCNNNNTLTRTW